jgi:hypothetical protein
MPEVIATLATPDPARFETAVVALLRVDLGGIPGDRHYGFTRKSGAREPWYPRGTEIRSGRLLNLVSEEELAIVAAAMGVPAIEPGWIGANVLLRGVENFSRLPWGSRLVFGAGAVLVNEGENVPCRQAGGGIGRAYPERDGLDRLFVKAAKHLRGIVATVERAGEIAPGPIEVRLPMKQIWPGVRLL